MPQIWIEPQQNSFLDTFAQAEKLKHYRSANALNDYKVQALEREAETAQRLREAYAGGADPMTDEGARQLMAAGADPKTIYGAQKERYAGKKNQSQTQGYDLDNALKKVEIGSQILSGVRDEGSYQWARQRAAKMELGTEDWPANFDPNWVQQTQAAGMQLKDQLAHKLNEQKFDEEQKQSGIDNQFQQGNLDVARGNLGVAQAGLEERRQYHQGMLNKPQSGFSMSYDAEGRPVFAYGTKSEETAMGTERGKTRAQAEQALPGIEDLSTATINQVDELLAHPGFESAVGATLLPYASRVPGTSEGDFVNRLDQLKGGAFLQAFERLKGGGQITQIEGEKATQAINRMNTATSEQEFQAAADAFKSVIVQARDRARNAAKPPQRVVIPYGAEPDLPAAPADAPNYKSLLDELMQ